MNESKLSPRLTKILYFLHDISFSRTEIAEKIAPDYPVSKATLTRDLEKLIDLGLVKPQGKGRNIRYISLENPVTRYFDINDYFKENLPLRNNAKTDFDFTVFQNLEKIFSEKEITQLNKQLKHLSEQKRRLDLTIFKRELERFTVEFSWKSSKIEGNTYSLLETEVLIKHMQEASGHSKYEANMILNHKKAIDYILANPAEFTKLSLQKIFHIHTLLTQDLEITSGIRKHRVMITGTSYIPLFEKEKIEEALTQTVVVINKVNFPLTKALIASSMLAYIQPFTDGNKRTARTLANALLVAHDLYPLSYRDIDQVEYIKAMILCYEQNSLFHHKRLFLEQIKFVNENYFL